METGGEGGVRETQSQADNDIDHSSKAEISPTRASSDAAETPDSGEVRQKSGVKSSEASVTVENEVRLLKEEPSSVNERVSNSPDVKDDVSNKESNLPAVASTSLSAGEDEKQEAKDYVADNSSKREDPVHLESEKQVAADVEMKSVDGNDESSAGQEANLSEAEPSHAELNTDDSIAELAAKPKEVIGSDTETQEVEEGEMMVENYSPTIESAVARDSTPNAKDGEAVFPRSSSSGDSQEGKRAEDTVKTNVSPVVREKRAKLERSRTDPSSGAYSDSSKPRSTSFSAFGLPNGSRREGIVREKGKAMFASESEFSLKAMHADKRGIFHKQRDESSPFTHKNSPQQSERPALDRRASFSTLLERGLVAQSPPQPAKRPRIGWGQGLMQHKDDTSREKENTSGVVSEGGDTSGDASADKTGEATKEAEVFEIQTPVTPTPEQEKQSKTAGAEDSVSNEVEEAGDQKMTEAGDIEQDDVAPTKPSKEEILSTIDVLDSDIAGVKKQMKALQRMVASGETKWESSSEPVDMDIVSTGELDSAAASSKVDPTAGENSPNFSSARRLSASFDVSSEGCSGFEIPTGARQLATKIYHQPSDYAFYQENIDRGSVISDQVRLKVRTRNRARHDYMKKLAREYVDLKKSWKQGVKKMEKDRKRQDKLRLKQLQKQKLKSLGESGPIRTTNTNHQSPHVQQLVAAEKAAEAAGEGTIVRTSSRLTNNSSADLENNDLEKIEQAKAQALLDQEVRKKRLKNALSTVIPDMLITPAERQQRYFTRFVNVTDWKLKEKAEMKVNPWNDLEKCIYMDKFLQFPKNFPRISSYLRNKTTGDVIAFYYRTKKVADYKALLREQQLRRRGAGSKNTWSCWNLSACAAICLGVQFPQHVAKLLLHPSNFRSHQASDNILNSAGAQRLLRGSKTKAEGDGNMTTSSAEKATDSAEGKCALDMVSGSDHTPCIRPSVPDSGVQLDDVINSGDSDASDEEKFNLYTQQLEQFIAGQQRPFLVDYASLFTDNSYSTGYEVSTLSIEERLKKWEKSGGHRKKSAAGSSSTISGSSSNRNTPRISVPGDEKAAQSGKKSSRSGGATPGPRRNNQTNATTASPKINVASSSAAAGTAPKWTEGEKADFLKYFSQYGKDWATLTENIPTKTAAQIKNYYQNYKNRLNLQDILKRRIENAAASGGSKVAAGASGVASGSVAVSPRSAAAGLMSGTLRQMGRSVELSGGMSMGMPSGSMAINASDPNMSFQAALSAAQPGMHGVNVLSDFRRTTLQQMGLQGHAQTPTHSQMMQIQQQQQARASFAEMGHPGGMYQSVPQMQNQHSQAMAGAVQLSPTHAQHFDRQVDSGGNGSTEGGVVTARANVGIVSSQMGSHGSMMSMAMMSNAASGHVSSTPQGIAANSSNQPPLAPPRSMPMEASRQTESWKPAPASTGVKTEDTTITTTTPATEDNAPKGREALAPPALPPVQPVRSRMSFSSILNESESPRDDSTPRGHGSMVIRQQDSPREQQQQQREQQQIDQQQPSLRVEHARAMPSSSAELARSPVSDPSPTAHLLPRRSSVPAQHNRMGLMSSLLNWHACVLYDVGHDGAYQSKRENDVKRVKYGHVYQHIRADGCCAVTQWLGVFHLVGGLKRWRPASPAADVELLAADPL
ncbi:SANT domain [Phytophthora cactorum]|nr:SANT domain [Phytophthora cactorum]